MNGAGFLDAVREELSALDSERLALTLWADGRVGPRSVSARPYACTTGEESAARRENKGASAGVLLNRVVSPRRNRGVVRLAKTNKNKQK